MKWTWLTSRSSRESRCIFIRPGGSAGTLSPSFSVSFTARVQLGGELFPEGSGWSRRRAKQAAAQAALDELLKKRAAAKKGERRTERVMIERNTK